MKHTNFKLAKGLGVAMLLAGSNLALAETVSVPATVTVNNAINFTFTGTLDFGTIRATAATVNGNCVGLTLPANPASPIATATAADSCATAGTAAAQAISGTPSRPVFTIAGVAPFATLKIFVPTTDQALTAATGPNTPQFAIRKFTAYKTNGTPGAIDVTTTPGQGSISADNSGNAVFTVGATLVTELLGATNNAGTYQDLAYAGSFDVTVTY